MQKPVCIRNYMSSLKLAMSNWRIVSTERSSVWLFACERLCIHVGMAIDWKLENRYPGRGIKNQAYANAILQPSSTNHEKDQFRWCIEH